MLKNKYLLSISGVDAIENGGTYETYMHFGPIAAAIKAKISTG
jgi:hypothetical protein